MNRWITFSLVLMVLLGASQAAAHHTSHRALTRRGAFNPFVQGSQGPNKRISFKFDWSHLDNGAGDVYTETIEGEYAFVDRFSLLAWVPLTTLDMNFRPNKTGLGDVGFGAKGQIGAGEPHAVTLGNDFTFPTGNRDAGTGVGAVTTSPYVAYQFISDVVQAFAGMGTVLELDSNPEPALLLPMVGLAFRLPDKEVPVAFFVNLRGQILLADETFEPGSSKVYVVPGMTVYPYAGQRLSIALFGTFSIIDTLSVKDSLSLDNDSLALTEDVFAGASLQINYSF